jgi:hypothetical protein
MMMECPRCAFVQPQDRFCANCGLNIATYQAKPEPWLQRLLGSPAFYLVAGITFVAALTLYLKRAQVEPPVRGGFVAEQTAPVAGGGSTQTAPGYTPPPAPPREREARPQPATSAAFAPPANTESPPPPNPATKGQSAATDDGIADGSAAATAPPAAPAAPKMPSQVEISFYEIPRDLWQPVAADAKSIGDAGVWRILQVAQKEKLNSALAGARRLPGQKQMPTQPSSIAQMHFPVGAPDTHQGVYFDFSAVKIDGANLEIEIAGEMALKIDATAAIQNRVDTIASMPAGGAVVLVGNINRKPLPEALIPQVGGSPLAILESPDFLEAQTELILVISGR